MKTPLFESYAQKPRRADQRGRSILPRRSARLAAGQPLHSDHAWAAAVGIGLIGALAMIDEEVLLAAFMAPFPPSARDRRADVGNHRNAVAMVLGRRPAAVEAGQFARVAPQPVIDLYRRLITCDEFRLRRGRIIASV